MFPPHWSPPTKASGTLHIHCLSSTSWKDLHGTQDIHDYINTSLIGDYFVECHLRCDVEVTVSVLCTIIFRTVSELIPLEEIDYRSFFAEI